MKKSEFITLLCIPLAITIIMAYFAYYTEQGIIKYSAKEKELPSIDLYIEKIKNGKNELTQENMIRAATNLRAVVVRFTDADSENRELFKDFYVFIATASFAWLIFVISIWLSISKRQNSNK